MAHKTHYKTQSDQKILPALVLLLHIAIYV